jgi:hypothetical protein
VTIVFMRNMLEYPPRGTMLDCVGMSSNLYRESLLGLVIGSKVVSRTRSSRRDKHVASLSCLLLCLHKTRNAEHRNEIR